MTSVANDLALALELADAADALTLDRFGALDLRVETKPDLTPVTDADRSTEELLRSSLMAHRPDDSVFGEELGGTAAFTGRQWVLDPIDGTKNFVRGVPVWSTLIALLVDGTPVVGVVSAPALGTPVVGRRRRGRVHVVRRRDTAHLGLRCRRPRLGQPVVLRPHHRLGWAASTIHRAHRRGVAGPRVRRLLVLLPGGRGRRRYRRRARGEAVGSRRRSTSWCARRAARSPISRADRGPHGGSAVATNGLLHDAVLARLNGM